MKLFKQNWFFFPLQCMCTFIHVWWFHHSGCLHWAACCLHSGCFQTCIFQSVSGASWRDGSRGSRHRTAHPAWCPWAHSLSSQDPSPHLDTRRQTNKLKLLCILVNCSDFWQRLNHRNRTSLNINYIFTQKKKTCCRKKPSTWIADLVFVPIWWMRNYLPS